MIKQCIRNAPCLVGLRCVGKCRPQKEIKFTGLHTCVVLEVLFHVQVWFKDNKRGQIEARAEVL